MKTKRRGYKKRTDIEKIEKDYKRLLVLFVIVSSFAIAVLLLAFLYLVSDSVPMYSSGKVYKGEVDLPKLTFADDINPEEKKYFINVYDDLNILFLSGQKEVIVAKNISGYCEEACQNQTTAGVNVGGGDRIIIKFEQNRKYLEDVICHELLHTYMPPSKSRPFTHDIIYLLGERGICFYK